jgi:hypothetical protein
MKKLLLGTVVLLAFNAAVILTQMSCKKEAKAEPAPTGATITQLDQILYLKHFTADRYLAEIWISKLDGSNNHKVNLALPSNMRVSDEAKLSPDGKIIVFSTLLNTTGGANTWGDGGIYTCNVDGSNVKKIMEPSADGYPSLQGVY